MNLETKWLEDFVALAATRSFSQAAQRRFVTQPAFSRRIRSLEEALGLQLINRSRTPIELTEAGCQCEREKVLPLTYRGRAIDHAYRLDLIIDGRLLVELKAVDAIQPIHRVQVTTYLKLLKLPLGLLINFNVPLIRDGITRILNLDLRTPSLPPLASSRLCA